VAENVLHFIVDRRQREREREKEKPRIRCLQPLAYFFQPGPTS
jgi:hypothetical protein